MKKIQSKIKDLEWSQQSQSSLKPLKGMRNSSRAGCEGILQGITVLGSLPVSSDIGVSSDTSAFLS